MAEVAIHEQAVPLRPTLIMAPVFVATTLFVVNQTNIVVALPHMQGTFSATRDQISWVITSYIVAMTIATAGAGWFTARLGRKRVYIACIAGFTFTSFLAGSAGTLEAEVLFRALQGCFGGPILPLSQAIVLDTYPKERHARALGIWGISITVGPVIGPIVGGAFTEFLNWPWVFYANIPVGIAALVAVIAFLPETPREPERHFDWVGFAALAIALAAIQLMLNRGQGQDWLDSREVVVELGLAVAAFYVFVVHSATTRAPFLSPAMLRDKNYVLGLLFVFAWGTMVASPIILLSLRLQGIDGYPVLSIGFLMAPRGLGGILAMLTVGRLVGLINPKLLIAAGFTAIATGAWVMSSWSLNAVATEVALAGLVFGFGVAFCYVPLTIITFATLRPQYRTEASALFSVILNVGNSIGIAIAIIVLSQGIQINHEALTAFVTPYNELFRAPALPEMWRLGNLAGLEAIEAEVQRQATAIAFNNTFRLISLVALGVIPLLYFLRRPSRGDSGD